MLTNSFKSDNDFKLLASRFDFISVCQKKQRKAHIT